MFKVTIEGNTPQEIQDGLITLLQQFSAGADRRVNDADDAAREELQAKRTRAKKPAPAAEPQSSGSTVSDAPSPEASEPDPSIDSAEARAAEREFQAAVAAESAEPAPATATGLVDAGTGQPIPPDLASKVVQMTMDDVRANAAKLAAVNTPLLGELIKKHG